MPQVLKTIPRIAHTKGPWHVTAGQRAIVSTDDQIVADVRGIFRPPLTRDTPAGQRRQHVAETYQDHETDGNATLLAAAPTMYHALRQVATHYLQHWSGDAKKKLPLYLVEVCAVLDGIEARHESR